MAASVRYDIAAESPDSVRAELSKLWTENLQLPTSPEKHFEWLYRAPLVVPPSVIVLRTAPADGPGEIVGTNGYSIRQFQIGAGHSGQAAVSGDLAVTLAHRSLLPALRLVRAVRDLVVTEFAVGYGFPNAKAEGVMKRAGFHVLGKTSRFARVLRHRDRIGDVAARLGAPPVLERVGRHHRVAGTLGRLLDVARLAGHAPQFVRARHGHRIQWLTSFDARFDELWERTRGEYNVIGFRTAEFLRWRYPACEIATLVRRDGTFLAYAIVQHQTDTGAAHLRDVFGHKAAIGTLFDLLMPALWRRGAKSASIRFAGCLDLEAVVRAHGFEQRPEQRTVAVQVGQSHEADRARLEDLRSWHILDIDEDT